MTPEEQIDTLLDHITVITKKKEEYEAALHHIREKYDELYKEARKLTKEIKEEETEKYSNQVQAEAYEQIALTLENHPLEWESVPDLSENEYHQAAEIFEETKNAAARLASVYSTPENR